MMSFHKASITREIDACHGYTSYGAADWRRTGSRRNLHAKLLHHLVVGHTLDPADERNQVLKERGFDVGIWNVRGLEFGAEGLEYRDGLLRPHAHQQSEPQTSAGLAKHAAWVLQAPA